MNQLKDKWIVLGALSGSMLLGGGGLIAISLFILLGAPGWIDFGWSLPAEAIWNLMLSMLFFVQHSVMIRTGVRQYLARRLSADYLGALYSVASGVILLLLVLLWQTGGDVLFSLAGPGRWIARLCAMAALAGFLWTAKSLQAFDPLGTARIMARLGKAPPGPMPITIRGPYRWVRHPFYFFTIVMIWSYPALTVDRLMFNVTWTAWIWVGAVLEERDLVAEYGRAYEEYRQNVPCLFPCKWRR